MHKSNVLEIYNPSNNSMRHVHEKKNIKICITCNQPFDKNAVFMFFSDTSGSEVE